MGQVLDLVLEVVSGVGIEAMTARDDVSERIVTGAGVVAGRASELGSAKFFRRVRRDQRFRHPTLSRAKRGVARRGGNA